MTAQDKPRGVLPVRPSAGFDLQVIRRGALPVRPSSTFTYDAAFSQNMTSVQHLSKRLGDFEEGVPDKVFSNPENGRTKDFSVHIS